MENMDELTLRFSVLKSHYAVIIKIPSFLFVIGQINYESMSRQMSQTKKYTFIQYHKTWYFLSAAAIFQDEESIWLFLLKQIKFN